MQDERKLPFNNTNKPVILTFVRYYLPGYKSGGPVRTIANMVEHLGDEFEFKIVTSDRDALDNKAYPDVKVEKWNDVGKAQVYYLPPEALKFSKMAALINETEHDLLYLNSFFDPHFTLLPLLARKIKRVPDKPVILAPRGEFSEGAVSLKAWKKRPYVKISKMIRLYNNITWQASSEYEKEDINNVLGDTADIIYAAPNLPPKDNSISLIESGAFEREIIKIIFLSRITAMKNLDYALRVLEKVNVPLEFHIYGPIRDENYWQRCLKLIDKMPKNVNVKYMGEVEHNQVPGILSKYDLFFLPTRGENYGHVIAESFAAGTPVLIANTTPWRHLEEAGVGWDLDLKDEGKFVESIEKCAKVSSKDYLVWRRKVIDYARQRLADPDIIEDNLQLFLKALESK